MPDDPDLVPAGTEAGGQHTGPRPPDRTVGAGAMAQRMGLKREIPRSTPRSSTTSGRSLSQIPSREGPPCWAAPADQRMIASTGATIIRHGPDFAAVADLVEAQAGQHRSIPSTRPERRWLLSNPAGRERLDDLTGDQEPATVSRGTGAGSTWAWAMTTTPRSWLSSRRPSHTARSHSWTVAPGGLGASRRSTD